MAEEPKMLVDLEKYLSAGVHIGTKYRTKSMAPFIYKINPTGLSVLNLQKVDERLGNAARFLAQFKPEEILVVSRRENGWNAVKQFAKAIGAKAYAGRYPAGVLTNSKLETFFEPKVILITDPWPDKNAVSDALQIGIPIVAFCDSNNTTNNVDVVIPCNNKGSKSLGLSYWILANEYLKAKGLLPKGKNLDVPLEKFTGEESS